ncbi:MAG: amidase family protein [Caldilineaceae bacterium]
MDDKTEWTGTDVVFEIARQDDINYTGHPAVAMPYQLDAAGLPIGVQLVGKRWGEARLLAAAQAVTQVTGGFRRPPSY